MMSSLSYMLVFRSAGFDFEKQNGCEMHFFAILAEL